MNNNKFIVVVLSLIVIFLCCIGIRSMDKQHEVNQKIKRLECEVEELRNINQSQEEVIGNLRDLLRLCDYDLEMGG